MTIRAASHRTLQAAALQGPGTAEQALYTSYERVRALLEDVAETLRAHEGLLVVNRAGAPVELVRSSPPVREAETPSPAPLPALELLCLGSFHIKVGDVVVDLGSGGKPAAIAKLLATYGRPVPRDVLVETLWPESDPAAGANRLRVAMQDLRRRLEQAGAGKRAVRYQGGSYEFHPDLRPRSDAGEFQALWERGVRLERERRHEEAIAVYRRAEGLYRGEFLADDYYEDWTLVQRETLRDEHLHVLGKLGAWSLEHRNYEDCMVFCQKLLLVDPCREDAYRMLMRCHAAAGRPAQASRWFEVCVSALRHALDVAPSRETVALYQSLHAPRSVCA